VKIEIELYCPNCQSAKIVKNGKINLAKNEADLRYEEASRNLRASSFSAARRSLELSRNKTNDALVLEEDAEYRKLTDERLEKLGKEINDEENKVVVKDVRRYLQDAKKDYFNSEFQAAENKLVAARNRWAVTNAEPNEEITNWINVVQSAGAVRTERIIQPSAPLYPQMMQLLNNSSELYSDAVKKMQQGSRAAAIKSLNEAKENIKQVLLVYPSNGTAGQLSLKIDKLIDVIHRCECTPFGLVNAVFGEHCRELRTVFCIVDVSC